MKKTGYIVIIFLLLSLIVSRLTLFNKTPELNLETTKKLPIIYKNEFKVDKPQKKASISLLACGDIMYHMPQIESAALDESFDFSDNFKYVKDYIQASDISVANFETTISANGLYSGYPNFKSPVESIESIVKAGFDGLVTANNHIYDMGEEGFDITLDLIKEKGLFNLGTSKENEGDKYIIKEINGIKVGMISYTYTLNNKDGDINIDSLSGKINIIDEEKIKNDLNVLGDNDADIKLVFLHWGIEYDLGPSDSQRDLAKKIVDWGGDIILGSHPHIVQESEIIKKDDKDKFIIYSLGNYLSNQRREILGTSLTEDGLMVNIIIEKDQEINETIIKDVIYIPTWVRKYKKESKDIYEILPVKDFIDNKDLNNKLSEDEKIKIIESYNNTIIKMKKFKRID